MSPGVKVTVLASQLLRDAATFFETVAEQNPGLDGQMRDNADVYRQVAERLDAGAMNGLRVGDAGSTQPTIVQLAARLITDAATFFQNVGAQNPALEARMMDNAAVFRALADLMSRDPEARLPLDS